MQATITYQITEQAQRAAMAATGQPVTRKQTVTEQIDNGLVNHHLATVKSDGSIEFDLARQWGFNKDGQVNGTWGYATVYSDLDAIPESGQQAIE
ncbi:MAG: hypothetical protein WBM24_17490, partial [Candidatus Sulfotelmatobacter sp.]